MTTKRKTSHRARHHLLQKQQPWRVLQLQEVYTTYLAAVTCILSLFWKELALHCNVIYFQTIYILSSNFMSVIFSQPVDNRAQNITSIHARFIAGDMWLLLAYNTPFTRWSWLDELARRSLDELAWWAGYLVIWMVYYCKHSRSCSLVELARRASFIV